MKILSHAGINFIELLKEDITNIDIVIQYFNNELKDFDTHLELKGKCIATANAEHVGWFSYYDTIRIEVKKVLNYISMQVDIVKSTCWFKFKEKHSRELSTRDIETYIKAEPSYINITNILLEVAELYDKSESIVESFKLRGYNLKNLTQLKMTDNEDWII
jgi:hypothetical protein